MAEKLSATIRLRPRIVVVTISVMGGMVGTATSLRIYRV